MIDSITYKKGGQEILEATIQETFDLIEEIPLNLENRQFLQ